jgi:hypothetical protein
MVDVGGTKNHFFFLQSVVSISIYHHIIVVVAYALLLLNMFSNVTLALIDSTSSIYYKMRYMLAYRSKHQKNVSWRSHRDYKKPLAVAEVAIGLINGQG